MALEDRVTERYRVAVLSNLTQYDLNDGTIDTTILGLACDDIEGMFETELGFVYDETEKGHVSAAVQGVVLLLQTWSQHADEVTNERFDQWRRDRLLRLRRKVPPKTNSELTPSDENPTGGTVRPRFDPVQLQDYKPGRRAQDWPK